MIQFEDINCILDVKIWTFSVILFVLIVKCLFVKLIFSASFIKAKYNGKLWLGMIQFEDINCILDVKIWTFSVILFVLIVKCLFVKLVFSASFIKAKYKMNPTIY